VALSQNDVAQLQTRIDAGDRAGFYILYYNMTGSTQALLQAQVSSYSGTMGQMAAYSNAAAKFMLGSRYPETTDQFSLSIATDLFNKIKLDVETGGTGVMSDQRIFDLAKQQWIDRDIGEFFPANVQPGLLSILGAPFTYPGTALVNLLGLSAITANNESNFGIDMRPGAVPLGGRQLTSPDGKVSYIEDASGRVVIGSVVVAPNIFQSFFQFSSTKEGNQVHIASSTQTPGGVVSVETNLQTSQVNGVEVVNSQTTTVLTPSGILKYVAGSSGDSTLTVGDTALTFHNGEFVRATPQGNAIDVVQRQTTGTQTTTVNWDGELERITKLNNDLSSSIKEYDPQNTHPYNELDVTKAPDGQVTGVQVFLDQAGATIGQMFGSSLGSALGGKDQITKLASSVAGGTIGSLIGQKFGLLVATSMATDLSQVSLTDVFALKNIDIASAGIGAVSSFLTAELGNALQIPGFGGQLFNAAANGFTLSVLTQVKTSITTGGLTFTAAIDAINWSDAVSGALHIENLVGTFLGGLLVPAKSHAGAVGGQLLGAIGSFLLPGIGSLLGTMLGTVIFDAFSNTPHPAATDLIDQRGYFYSATNYQSAEGGDYGVANKMADPALAIINGYLNAVNGAALDHSKQVTIGYQTDPQSYISGVPTHPAAGVFYAPGFAVQAAAVDVLQHTEVIGGDLILKRAHANSSFHNPPPMPPADQSGDPGPTGAPIQPIATTQLAIMSGDLGVAQDYENYLNNREAINALMAANPDSAFTVRRRQARASQAHNEYRLAA
jgi:uncharacterized membrane protein YeaQ/YmgE (transglycosylase-associated protein family)